MFLTQDELVELTGYKHRAKQVAVLVRMGYTPTQRPHDGRVLVLRAHVEAKLGGKPGKARREPDYSHLEAAT